MLGAHFMTRRSILVVIGFLCLFCLVFGIADAGQHVSFNGNASGRNEISSSLLFYRHIHIDHPFHLSMYIYF